MKTKYQIRRGFTLVELLVVIAIIATLAGVGVPVIMSQKKKGDRSQAINNAKEIGMALFNFDQEYGSFPCTATATTLTDNGSTLTFGTANSNDYFRQLIAGGVTSEKPFYAKAAYTKKPDNVMTTDKALAAGEVGFAYIMKSATEALPSSGNTGRPIIVSSMKDAVGTDFKFDKDVYDRMAVVQRIDNSASLESINKDDLATIGGGKTLFETGADSVWEDITPTIKPPLKAP